jgi:replicative DNA helicase
VLVDALAAVDERTEGRPRGLLTGYHGLDDLTGGMRPGQLIIVAARPGLGKSCFSLCVAENCMANHDSRVLIVSLEMSRLEVAERLLAARGHIPLHHLTNNQMSRSERQTLVETSSAVGEMKLVIDDSSERTVTEIAALCRRMKRRGGLDLVIVDYLTLVRADNERDQREEQVAKIARRMKTLARELNAPVVALAQLNREVAKAADNRPQLHHLRSSGAIEQDADQVWMLHRQDYYATTDAERNETEGKAEVIVAKSRNGRTGTVHLSWERRWGRFENQQPKEFT